jgi:D-alanine-D-alanine ligase
MDEEPSSSKNNPLTSPRIAHLPIWKVAVIANIKEEIEDKSGEPPDAGAEYDHPHTIEAIKKAIECRGHRTAFLPADQNLPFALSKYKPDICFNIAEGRRGEGREAQVPALLEMLGIPYTASRIVAHAISLNKTLTKRIWRDMGLPVAPFQEFIIGDEDLRHGLSFPLFVKPVGEGTGMGVDPYAVVHNEKELRKRVEWLIETYQEPALVEAFLPGREFTVGILGRKDAPTASLHPYIYDKEGFFRFPISEIESDQSVTPGVYGYEAKIRDLGESGAVGYHCPAEIEPKLADRMWRLAKRAHRAIGAVDVSRVDFRLDAQAEPCLIEINTLPGIAPDFSDLSIMASKGGLAYPDLILEILYLAASRFGLLG